MPLPRLESRPALRKSAPAPAPPPVPDGSFGVVVTDGNLAQLRLFFEEELAKQLIDSLVGHFGAGVLPHTAPAPVGKKDKSVDYQGIPVTIDRPAGFVQEGKDEHGNPWERTYTHDYGFIPKTAGGDGEELDVFLGPNPAAEMAFWVSQQKSDGSFDEFKIFLGFDSVDDVYGVYCAHIPKLYWAGATEVPMAQMKALLGLPPYELAKRMIEVQRKADWTGGHVNDLPDSAFLYVEPGGKKDEDGRTTPRSLRHFPYRNMSGAVDLPHLRNALSRIPQSDLPAGVKDRAAAHARRLLDQATEKADMPAPKPGEPGSLEPQSRKKPKTSEWIEKCQLEVVSKSDTEDECYVFGVVLVPEEPDLQKDIYSADVVKRACYEYMESYRHAGDQHKTLIADGSDPVGGAVVILENYLSPVDIPEEVYGVPIKKGTWLMGQRVRDPEQWRKIKCGERTGFSIGGAAESEAL